MPSRHMCVAHKAIGKCGVGVDGGGAEAASAAVAATTHAGGPAADEPPLPATDVSR